MGLLPDGWSLTPAAGPHTSTSLFAALHSQDWKTETTALFSIYLNKVKWTLKTELLWCGAPLFSGEEKLSGRRTDSTVSVGSECVAEVCVIDRTFQRRVNDMQCKLMQMNPLFPLDKWKKIILWSRKRAKIILTLMDVIGMDPKLWKKQVMLHLKSIFSATYSPSFY